MGTDKKTMSSTAEQEIGAAMVASGIGSTMLGLTTVLAEISEPLRSSLFWFGRGGPLGGETSLAVIAFLVSWAGLTIVLKKYPVRLRTAFIVAMILVSAGSLLTFPPVFRLIAHPFGA